MFLTSKEQAHISHLHCLFCWALPSLCTNVMQIKDVWVSCWFPLLPNGGTCLVATKRQMCVDYQIYRYHTTYLQTCILYYDCKTVLRAWSVIWKPSHYLTWRRLWTMCRSLRRWANCSLTLSHRLIWIACPRRVSFLCLIRVVSTRHSGKYCLVLSGWHYCMECDIWDLNPVKWHVPGIREFWRKITLYTFTQCTGRRMWWRWFPCWPEPLSFTTSTSQT